METPISLFEGYGVELEYMIVDAQSLDVRPVADKVLHAIAGAYESEVERDDLAWSNELVNHVIELKTNGPAPALDGLDAQFQSDVAEIESILSPLGCRLMPTAAHPWMDPARETMLWPHEYNPVYASFDRIFGCKGHGWSNLQCTHINLPFAGDDEFGRLHAAIRLVLPLIPALAASSPILDAKRTGLMDARLDTYRNNARKIPQVTGKLIPEPAYTRADYEARILDPLYKAIAPHDPEGILQYEWLNARGAIARFDRDAIEIRTVDIQECPLADLAVTHAIVSVIRALVAERWIDVDVQMRFDADALNRVLVDTTHRAGHSVISDSAYLDAFGVEAESMRASALWQRLIEDVVANEPDIGEGWLDALELIVEHGTLARRILHAIGDDISRPNLSRVYGELCDCLREGRSFHAPR